MAIPRIQLVRRTRRVSRLLVWLLAPFVTAFAGALAQTAPAPNTLPQGGQVRTGSAQITQGGQLLLIQQSTPKLGIDWQSFSIGSDATVEFRQPSAASVALNRVIGPDPSAIFGRLQSNGQVFLTNPNGVLFAPGAKIDVGGLIASTLDLSQDDFAAGRYSFSAVAGSGAGSVVNQGRIDASGYVALFGTDVANEGEIAVPAGSVVLASGRAATVTLSETGLLSAVLPVDVTPGAQGSVINSGQIAADGGSVRLTARSAEGIAGSLVNNTGVVRANAIVERGGEILITGDHAATSGQLQADGSGGASGGRIVVRGDMTRGSVTVGGTISARALDAGGTGGRVETSAARVAIDGATRVTTLAADGRHGEWLIDPTDFVVSAGSGTQTTSGIGAATLATNLESGNVTLLTASEGDQAGDIRVEAPVSWAASTTLTLSSVADIAINANITATGNAAGLTISAGSGRYTVAEGSRITLSGSSPSLSINGTSYIVINSLTALQAIGNDYTALGRSYALGGDIDATETATWNDGAGFRPIGDGSNFYGNFDGLGHTITGLTINRPSTSYTGLFGYAANSRISNLTLSGGLVVGGYYTGAVVGFYYGYSAGSAAGLHGVRSDVQVVSAQNSGSSAYVGGLVGYMAYGGSITNSHATGSVFVDAYNGYAGGLLGYGYYTGGIYDSSASGQVQLVDSYYGYYYGLAGGLVGQANNVALTRVSASGAVSGGGYSGGLAGQVYGSTVSEASASGPVSGGTSSTGGLIGYVSSSTLTDVSATGTVQSNSSNLGGLVGEANGSTITRATASGAVTSVGGNGYNVGGLLGYGSSVDLQQVSASGEVRGRDQAGYVGGLFGSLYYGDLVDASASGDVYGGSSTGGLGGYLYVQQSTPSTVARLRASGDVHGGSIAGGLLGNFSGYNYSGSEYVGLSDARATGAVSAFSYAGGLIGYADTSGVILEDLSATGAVTVGRPDTSYYEHSAGGLIGSLQDYSGYYSYYYGYTNTTTLRRSYASGAVSLAGDSLSPTAYLGGLIGQASSYYYYYMLDQGGMFSIEDSHASGAVTASGSSGSAYVGGLIGRGAEVSLRRTLATGAVSVSGGMDSQGAGGLVGQMLDYDGQSSVFDSYWNTTTTGQATSSGGGTGLDDVAARQAASYVGWDIAITANAGQTWRIYEDRSHPLLTGFLTPLTLTLADESRAYDGTTGSATDPKIRVAGMSPDVGSYALAASTVYSTQDGYDLDVSGSGVLTVTPRQITLDGVVAGKVYDGTTAAQFLAGAQPTGLVAGEDLTLDVSGASANFADKNAGTGKTVTVSGYTVGSGVVGKASNYTVVGTAQADIERKAVSAGGFTATDRVYDGTTAVAVTLDGTGALTGALAGDTVSLSNTGLTGTMADKHVGTAKAVAVGGVTLTGTDAGNYRLEGVDDVTVNITPKVLAVSGVTANNRAYDSTDWVYLNLTNATMASPVAGDLALLGRGTSTGTMVDRHAGTGKAITGTSIAILGPDAQNYSLLVEGVTVDITPRTVYGYAYSNYNYTLGGYGFKEYDGTADASALTVVYASGLYSIDEVTMTTASVTFADKNVAYDSNGNVTNRTITADGFALTGTHTGNYVLANTSYTTSGRIVPKSLAVTGVTATNRVYDGTVNVQVNIDGASVDSSLVIAGDDVAVSVPSGGSLTGTVASKNVGTGKAVAVPGLSLTGTDAGNYTLTGSNGVTVDITRKDLNVAYTGVDKQYDGTTRALVSAASGDIVAGDDVQFYTNVYGSYGCLYGYYSCYASFTGDGAKNAGTNKPVSISYEYLYGNDAGNYQIVGLGEATTTANLLPRNITPSVIGVNKVYDGTAAATVSLYAAGSGIVSGDDVTLGLQTAVFTGDGAKNVGTNKPVSVSDITLAGTDAANYTLSTSSATTMASITPKPVNVTGVVATDRVYDGTVTVQVTATAPSVEGLIAGDAVGVVLPLAGISTGTMLDRHVGTAKPVSVTGLELSGADAGNYTLTGSAGTVNITPKPITVGYVGQNKVYDGSVVAYVTASSAGLVPDVGDSVGFSQTAVFTGTGAKNAGTAKPIEITDISLYGAHSGNYTLENTTASATADITPKAISVGYVGVSRVYNGRDDLSATVLGSASGLVAGDSVGLNQTARFADNGNVGSNKQVDVTDISLAGVNAGNYTLTSTSATTTASITPKLLGVAGMSAVNRTYDGTTTVQVNVTSAAVDLTGVIGSDQVTVSLPPQGITSGEMADKHVGQNKAVSVTGLLLGGADAANYALTGADALTVDITPASISAVYTGIDKIYDGSTAASVLGTSAGFALGDSVGIAASAFYTGDGARNVGTNKPITVSDAFLTGADRFNYVLENRTGTTTASITPRTLTPIYIGGSRAYDGTVTAPVTASLGGLISGDAVSVSQTAAFTGDGAKNVGTGKPIAVEGVAIAGADAGNYVLGSTTAATTGTITPRLIVVEGLSGMTATPRAYDGTTLVSVTVPDSLTGTPRAGDILAGEQVSVQVPSPGTAVGTMADKRVGTDKPVLVTGLGLSGADAGNYAIAEASGVTVDITPLDLSALYTGLNKVYDGTAHAQVSVALTGVIAGDSVAGSASGSFTAGKNAGLGKTVAVTGGTLSGADAGNYSLTNPEGTTTADITPRAVTAVYVGGTKVYDGTTTAPVTGSLSGAIAGDTLELSQTAVFSGGKNVGTNKLIAVSGIALSGGDAGNYELSSETASTTGSVTPRAVVIEGLTVTAQGREYDGTTTVAVQVQAASGGAAPRAGDVIAGDLVTVNVPVAGETTGTMADKHAGTGKAIVVSGLSLSGDDAANYEIAGTAGLTVDIAPRSLTATWTGLDKVYDGTNAAAAVGTGDRVVAGDLLSISGSGLFSAGKNVGTGLAIEIQSALLSGADAGNYTLSNPTGSATASITPRTLDVAYTGGTRVYDGTTLAPVSGSLGNVIEGDVVNLTQSAVFTGTGAKNVGTGKAVSVTDIALTGADAGNYRSPIAATTTTASVTPRDIVIDGLSAQAASREYDGTTTVSVDLLAAAGVGPRAGDVISGDEITITVPDAGQTAGTMADKHVGTGKAVVITGLSLAGADAANYRIAGVDGVTVDITPRSLTAAYTGVDKVYDGTSAATATGSATRLVAGDDVVIGASGVFTAGKNVGTGLAIEIQSALLSGADAGNYTLSNTTGTATADITPRTLAAVYTGVDKVYDGTTSATVQGALDGVIAGDVLNLSQSAVFTGGKNVGTAKDVLVAGIALDGADAGNYRLLSTEAATTASITPRPLNVTGLTGLTAQDRVYDGTTSVQLLGTASLALGLEGAIGGDEVTLTQGGALPSTGTMADKHVGSDKAVVVGGLALSGADAGNYSLGGVVGLTVNITPLPVTLSGLTAVNRTYDGTLAVAIDTLAGSISGVLAGDDLSLLTDGVTGRMADKHAGLAKAVTLDGLAFGGADAGNYSVQTAGDLRVDISPRLLAIAGTAQGKVYDGSTAASVSYTDDRLTGDSLGIAHQSAVFASRNAGSGVAVNVTGLALTGDDAGNYALASDSLALSADIARRALTLEAVTLGKVYGTALALPGSGFTATGLVSGETVGSVVLSSDGAAATAHVGSYALQIGGASGGSFDPANYQLSYVDGRLTVTPRPLNIAAHTLVRYADEPNPSAWGYASRPGDLVNGDTLGSVLIATPAGSEGATGGSVFTLQPQGAVFATGLASDYELRYANGLLIVLPQPPRFDDADGGTAGGGDPQFAVQVSPEEVASAVEALRRAAGAARAAVLDAPQGPDPRPVGGEASPQASAEVADLLAALLRGETQRITLPTLLRLPLISLDPKLRRLIVGAASTPTPGTPGTPDTPR